MSALLRYVCRHHVGLIAVFIAIGGTAYAATALPPNSVGTRQLRRHAVTLLKIDPGTARALRGRRGQKGPRGLPGPTGPSDSYHVSSLFNYGAPQNGGVSVAVPPGNYTAVGSCTALYTPSPGTSLAFSLATGQLTQGPPVNPALLSPYGAEASVPEYRRHYD